MYVWKCWRDTRSTFFLFLGAMGLLAATGAFLLKDVWGWTSSRAYPGAWEESGRMLLTLPAFLVLLTGFILGGYGVGDEFSKGTAGFLLTRPCARRRLLWSNWLVGAVEIALLVLLAAALRYLAPAGVGYPRLPTITTFEIRRAVLSLLLALMVYSLTFFFTMWLRNGRHGTNLAVVLILAYYVVAIWLLVSFRIQAPFFGDGRFWLGGAMPWGEVTIRLFVILSLVVSSQWLLERAEA